MLKQKRERKNHNEQQDYNRFFDTREVKNDLKNRSVFGGAAMMLAQAIKLCLQVGSTIILARLLTPADYGLIAMVTAITAFVAMFQDMGLSMATIQKDEINQDQVSTIFWVNVGFSVILMLLTAAIAPVIARFYGEPRLMWITIVLSSSIIFGGLATQHQALLGRQMRLGILSVIQVVSMAAGYVAGIFLALNNAGYWSLVAIQIVIPLVNVVGIWLACSWLPGRPVRGAGTRQMLRFGLNVSGFSAVNYFAKNMDNVLLGRFCGDTVLGLYSKAYQLMLLPLTNIKVPLTQVALPALSSLQKDATNFNNYYLRLIALVAFITMPLTVFMFVCSKNIIALILGPQWTGAIIIFKILAVFAFIQPVAATTGIVLVSLGQTGRYLKWGIFNSLAVVASFIVGLPWGGVGVASAYTVVNYCLLFPLLWYSFRESPVSPAHFIKTLARPAITSIVTGFVIFFVHQEYLAGQSDIITLFSCFFLALIVYFLTWFIPQEGRQVVREYFYYVKPIFLKFRISRSV